MSRLLKNHVNKVVSKLFNFKLRFQSKVYNSRVKMLTGGFKHDIMTSLLILNYELIELACHMGKLVKQPTR